MTCQEVVEALSPYHDGRLPAQEAREVDAHLEACPACRQELEALRWTSRLLACLPAMRLAVDLAPGVVARAPASWWRRESEALRDLIAPRRGVVVRELARAAVIVGLFVLAATARGRGPSDLVISWPGRVAGAAGTGMARVTVGLAEARVFLSGGAVALPSEPVSSPTRKGKSERARGSSMPSNSAVAVESFALRSDDASPTSRIRQEVTSHVLA